MDIIASLRIQIVRLYTMNKKGSSESQRNLMSVISENFCLIKFRLTVSYFLESMKLNSLRRKKHA